jgi:hypothetical protein
VTEKASASYDVRKDTLTMDWPPAVMELVKAVNEEQSGSRAIARLVAEGRLGIVARALTEMAEAVSKSGYAPQDRRAEVQRLEMQAASTSDRELARYYKDRARKARSQTGETG